MSRNSRSQWIRRLTSHTVKAEPTRRSRSLKVERLEDRVMPAAPPVQFFYLPLPADAMQSTLQAISPTAGPTLTSVTSITATVNNTIIYYDQWEDGYDPNLAGPGHQATTQIWGDGDPTNGIAPGFATDIINAGAVITLRNDVPAKPRDPAQIFYDGGDFIGSSQTLAITRAGWTTNLGTVLAGAVEVYDTRFYGKNFTAPVGTDVAAAEKLFSYSAFYVMASQDNTTVNIDVNGDGTPDTTITLNRGQNYLSAATLVAGATVKADKPVQVHLATGDIGDTYESRWFTLFDDAQLASDYYSPVGTVSAVHPVNLFVHNPGAAAITVNFEDSSTIGSFTIAARSTYQYIVPGNTATHLYTASGSPFEAIAADDVQANLAIGDSQTYDWGFSLQPTSSLSPIAVVGWGPGSSNTPPTENYSPIWVTPTRDTTVYVDFDGDPTTGPNIDPNGNRYDVSYNLTRLQTQRIFDPDNNQTGMRLYTLDGTLISAAWGEDPSVAVGGSPAMDIGTTIPAYPVPIFQKSVAFAPGGDANGDGFFNSGDTLRYTLTIKNLGLYPILNSVVSDNLPPEVTYLANSTLLNDGTTTSAVSDAGTTPFPLDEGGYTVTNVTVGGTTTMTFDAKINVGLAGGTKTVTNIGKLSFGLVFDQDRAVAPIRAIIGDRVWNDLNGNGIQDAGEPGLGNVTLNLYKDINSNGVLDAGDQLAGTVTTDAAGTYHFPNLDEGRYLVKVTDTNAVLTGGALTSPTDPLAVTLIPGEVMTTADFGYHFNLVPVAVDDGVFSTTRNVAVVTGNVLTNDTPGDAPTVISSFQGTSAQGGTVVNNGDGTFTYTPKNNFVGADTFTYTIRDVDGDTSTATVTMSVAFGNRPPTATNNTNTATEDVKLTATGNVITDNDGAGVDSDPDGDPLTVSAVNGAAGKVGNPVAGTYGSVTIRPDGSYTYNLNNASPIVQALAAGQTVTDTFAYTVSDGNGGTATANLTITITGTNDAPVAVALPPRTNIDTDIVSVNVSGFFSDPDSGDTLTFSALNLPPGLSIDPVTGIITGTLPVGASAGGPYTVTITASDGHGGTVSAPFVWTVRPLAALSGSVYIDHDNNGTLGAGDLPLAGATVTLTGTNDLGASISVQHVSAADGTYSFTNLRPGTYQLRETQPAGYLDGADSLGSLGGTPGNDQFTGIAFGSGAAGAGYNFGELRPAAIAGSVFDDLSADGIRQPAEAGLPGVAVTLTGADDQGAVTQTFTTDANGNFSFGNLRPGTYSLTEAQPAGWFDGQDRAGSLGGSAGPLNTDRIGSVPVVEGNTGAGYTFAELRPARLGGIVFNDINNNGIQDNGEPGIAGTTVALTGTSDIGPVAIAMVTAADGSFQFTNLRPGRYDLGEAQPAGYIQGKNTVGDQGGTLAGDTVLGFDLDPGYAGTGNRFGERQAGQISGGVYLDANNNGQRDPGEGGLANVIITLTGMDTGGAPVMRTATTGVDGTYTFANLPAGTYSIFEAQPAGLFAGRDQLGNGGGQLGRNLMTGIVVRPNQQLSAYLFAQTTVAPVVADPRITTKQMFLGSTTPTVLVAGTGTLPMSPTFANALTPAQQQARILAAGALRPTFVLTGMDAGQPPTVRVFDFSTGMERFHFSAFDASFAGGVRVAQGDVTGDGVNDIIVAAGPGGGPQVKVFDGVTGQPIASFYAYAANFSGGVNVASADIDGDGYADIITGAGAGGGPHVKVFSGRTGQELRSFMAYDTGFAGGVTLAASDLNGDGKPDILTAAGPGGTAHVKAFDGQSLQVFRSFFAFDPSFRGGAYVAAGDVDGDGRADIIVGAGAGGGPNVRIFSGIDGRMVSDAMVYDAAFAGGVHVAAADINGDGRADLVVAPGAGGGPHVRILDATTGRQLDAFWAYDPAHQGGVTVG